MPKATKDDETMLPTKRRMVPLTITPAALSIDVVKSARRSSRSSDSGVSTDRSEQSNRNAIVEGEGDKIKYNALQPEIADTDSGVVLDGFMLLDSCRGWYMN